MNNIYGFDQKLNLEEIFTNDEIKSLKKSFPLINILIRSSTINNSSSNKENFYKSKFNKQEILKDKIYIYKRPFYKLILENIKNMFKQKKNNIMIKSLSCLIDDLSIDNINMNKNNSKAILNNNNNNNKKQISAISLMEKKINDIKNDLISSNINNKNNNSKD